MSLILTYECKDGSRIVNRSPFKPFKPHTCFSKKDHTDDSVKPELKHKTRSLKKGDLCYCGGNPDHMECGGSGRML
jgi:hypothetical protein